MTEAATATDPVATADPAGVPEGGAPTGTPEGQPSGQAPQDPQAGGQEPKADGQEPKADLPESYEFQMPEGVEADPEALSEFEAIAKELKLSQDDAQRVAQVGAKMVLRQQEAHVKQVESWIDEVHNDKEIGGDKLDENLAVARKAIDTFGSPELKQILNVTGLGNHPAMVKMAVAIGRAISEDGFAAGGRAAGSVKPMEEIMFPSMFNKG